MPNLPVLKARQVVAALERAGFHQVRQKSSHVQLKKDNLLVTVPMLAADLNPGTLRSIIHQARMTMESFADLL